MNIKAKTIIQAKKKCKLYLKHKSNMIAIKTETLQNLIYETVENIKSK